MNELSKKDIENALSKTMHPEINFSLLELGMIKNIKTNKEISLDLNLPFLEIPIKEDLIKIIKNNLKKFEDFKINITIKKMNEKEKEKFMEMAKQGWKI